MLDQAIRNLITKKRKIKNIEIAGYDILLFVIVTVAALYMRYALRHVVAGDYKMFFEPWVATLREAGGGIKGLGAKFEYVDYTTPYLLILSYISICPFLNTLLLMKLVSVCFDFSAAFAMFMIVYSRRKNITWSIFAYAGVLLAPTIVTNGSMWAQCDIIFTSFILWSIYFMLRGKPVPGMIFYGIAFAFKLQTLFLAPFYLILWMKGKCKLKHFLFLPLMYFIGVLPAWYAGQNLWDLLTVYLFQANGAMDFYALSHKFPNIYQLIGTDVFLYEYADAGIYLTLIALMVVLYLLAIKKFEITDELFVRMALLLTMCVVFFLPHMHERYAILADVLSILLIFINPKRFYVPLITILCSFAGYTMYLAHTQMIPLYVYTFLFLGLMLDHGYYLYKTIIKQNEVTDGQVDHKLTT